MESQDRREGLSRGGVIALLAAFVLGAAFRFWLIGAGWVDPDEGAHLMDGRMALEGEIPGIDFVARQPLYVYAYSVFGLVFGDSLLTMRVLPVLFSLASGWLIYLVGRDTLGPRAGLIAAVFFLLAPFVVVHAAQTKTGPMTIFVSVLAVYLYVRAQRSARPYLLLVGAGATCAAAYYVRESTLAIVAALTVAALLEHRFRLIAWRRAIAVAAGFMLAAGTVVVAVSLARPGARPWQNGSINPAAFVLRQVGPLLARGNRAPAPPPVSTDRAVDSLADSAVAVVENEPAAEPERLGQNWQETKRELGIALSLNVPLIVTALLALIAWPLAMRTGYARRAGASVIPAWAILLTAAYGFYTLKRGFFPAYFTEFVPSLALLSGFTLTAALRRLEGDSPSRNFLAVVGVLAVAFFLLQKVIPVPTLHRPVYFAVPTTLLGLYWLFLPRTRVRAGLVAAAAVALITMAAIGIGAFVHPLLKYGMYLGVIPVAVAALWFFATAPQQRNLTGLTAFSVLALSLGALAYSLDVEAKRIGRGFAGVWETGTISRVSRYLREAAEPGMVVMSGAVIWEYEADLDPFMGISHPLGIMGGLSPGRRERMERTLQTNPPAFIIVDGFTEVTYLRQLPGLRATIDERYTLGLSVPGTRFGTPVEVFRLRDDFVPQAGGSSGS